MKPVLYAQSALSFLCHVYPYPEEQTPKKANESDLRLAQVDHREVKSFLHAKHTA